MTKTKEELTQFKEEYETLNDKLKQLSAEELKEVIGGKVIGGVHVNTPIECPADPRTCAFSSKEECPHANYGRQSITDCKYN